MRTGAAILAFLLVMGTAQAHAKHRRHVRPAPVTTSLFGGSDLVSYMRGYLNQNPTEWGHRWCGKFLDMALRATGRPGGGNLARGYASYGTAAAGPAEGVIAVWRGHVGVVTGIDANGNPIVISGNVSGRVYEGVSHRGRPIAWRNPN